MTQKRSKVVLTTKSEIRTAISHKPKINAIDTQLVGEILRAVFLLIKLLPINIKRVLIQFKTLFILSNYFIAEAYHSSYVSFMKLLE